MNQDLQGRLYNYKFESALRHLEGEPEHVQETVKALARMFGNPGWGIEGDMETIIVAALQGIGLPFDDEEEPEVEVHVGFLDDTAQMIKDKKAADTNRDN